MSRHENRTDSGIPEKERSDGKRKRFSGIDISPYRYDYKVIELSSTRLMFIPKNERDSDRFDRFDPEINSLPKEKRPDGPCRHHIKMVSRHYTDPT